MDMGEPIWMYPYSLGYWYSLLIFFIMVIWFSPWFFLRWIDRYNHLFSVSLELFLSFSREKKYFIFLPTIIHRVLGNIMSPYFGSITSNSYFVSIHVMLVLTFFHNPMGSIKSWLANSRYILNLIVVENQVVSMMGFL